MKYDETSDDVWQNVLDEQIDRAVSHDKLVFRGLYLVISTSILFGVLGGIIGWVFSLLVPAYFRNVYDALDSEVWQLAVGMGVARGLLSGVVAGSAAMLAAAWYRSRIKSGLIRQYQQQQQLDQMD